MHGAPMRTAHAAVLAQLPDDPVHVPRQTWEPLITAFGWLLWFGGFVGAVAFLITAGVLVNRRRSTDVQQTEEATLMRILIGAALLAAAAPITNALFL